VISGSDDGTARLWDLEGNEVNVFKGHNGAVQSIDIAPDGEHLLTSSADATARIWPLFVDDVIKKIEEKKSSGFVWNPSASDKSDLGFKSE